MKHKFIVLKNRGESIPHPQKDGETVDIQDHVKVMDTETFEIKAYFPIKKALSQKDEIMQLVGIKAKELPYNKLIEIEIEIEID